MDYHVTPSTIVGVKAVAGDTIYLSGDIYRGTYTIPSGVTVVGTESTTITGLDVVTGFTQTDGYYTANVSALTPLGGSMGADQVFIDGVEVLEARWPLATIDTRGDISSWAEAVSVYDVVDEGSHLVATYEAVGVPAGDLSGCYAHVLNGHQWISIGGQVIASDGNRVIIRFPSDGKNYNIPTPGSRFYLWGGPLLPGGFYIANGLLHLTSDPSSSTVELKARHWGLDLRGSSNITIKGINLQSCSIRTDGGTTALTLDSISIYNMTHFQAPTQYWWGPSCITIRDGGRVTNTNAYHCAGGFLNVRGSDCMVDNVTVMDVTYSGCCQAGISLQGEGHTVSRSTLGKAGSSALLDMRKVTNSTFRGCQVYGGGGILTDGGTVMFADSHVTTDQGNRLLESVIHDTRGRTGPNLYGNAGVYIEQRASVSVSNCHIWGATSNDLQAIPLTNEAGYVVVERCTVGTLNISYSGGEPSIPITYRDNIVRVIKGSIAPATITDNYIAARRLDGNTQAPSIFSTLEGGMYPGLHTPPHSGARGGYFYGAYDTRLIYKPAATRDPISGIVRIRLDGPPPPDGFTVRVGSTEGVVRQYINPTPHLMVTFPPAVSGPVDLELAAPDYPPRTLGVVVPGNLRLSKSRGMSIQGVGFSISNLVRVLVTITSMEESWDVPIPIPVGEYIRDELMGADGAGISVGEGYPLYIDNTYPVGGTHAWVRVPYIPVGDSTFTILLGGSENVSNAGAVFLIPDFHLREGLYSKDLVEGISVGLDGTDLVIAGTTTAASKFGFTGVRVSHDYLYNDDYFSRPFAWDSYITMAPNSADYWQSGLGNNSFSLCKGGSTVTGDSNQASTLGRQFARRLVSNIQLPTSLLWQEDLVTINTRSRLPNARGIFNIMVGQVGKAIDYRFHYIRARGVPDSGVLPTVRMEVQQTSTRLWVGGVEYTDHLSDTTASSDSEPSTTLLLATSLPLAPGSYDLRVVLDNGQEYTLEGGYEVPDVHAVPPKVPTKVSNEPTVREVLQGSLSTRPLSPNPGQVYISHEGVCYAYLGSEWVPYQAVGEALPITGAWPMGTILAMVGPGILPPYTIPLAGQELPLSQYGALYEALRMGLPKTDGKGVEGSTHFLLPNYGDGMVSIPGNMGVGFGGWLVHQPGKDYTVKWLVVV